MPFALRFMALFLFKMTFTLLLSRGGKVTDDLLRKILDSPLLVIVGAPIFEELLFRYLPILFGATSIFDWSMITSSLLFALAHMPNYREGHLLQFFKFVVISCIYAWVAINWGILYAILMHILNNALAYLFLAWNRHRIA
jgi:membrane protease YdiL (CAAX protease family)